MTQWESLWWGLFNIQTQFLAGNLRQDNSPHRDQLLCSNHRTTIKTIPWSVHVHYTTRRRDIPWRIGGMNRRECWQIHLYACWLAGSQSRPTPEWGSMRERPGLVPIQGTVVLSLSKYTLTCTHANTDRHTNAGSSVRSLSFMQIFCLSVMSGMPGYRLCSMTWFSMGLPRHRPVCMCVCSACVYVFVCVCVWDHLPASPSFG